MSFCSIIVHVQGKWDAFTKNQVPLALGQISALWTLKNCGRYYDAKGYEHDNYLMQLHPAQVIAIFRMLNIGTEQTDLTNNLIEVLTGEGKSIIMACVAIILALFGYSVYCTCYSKYLSERDFQSFSSIFNELGLLEYIQYGEFHQLSEKVINEYGNVRKQTNKLICENKFPEALKIPLNRPKILLIDEVDVFFAKNFFGDIYTPTTLITDESIFSLIDCIWSRRKSDLRLRDVKKLQPYIDCSKKYNEWMEIFDESIKSMIADLKSFEGHSYKVIEDKIAYETESGYSTKIVQGYKTLFAYYLEYENERITKQSLQEHKGILINCGRFSYAEIPHKFKNILGVSGTLKALTKTQMYQIKDRYKIKKFTYLPSVFGKTNLKFDTSSPQDVQIEKGSERAEQNQFFFRIQNEIIHKLGLEKKRAVLVFFENEKKLRLFEDFVRPNLDKDSLQVLTEKANSRERDVMIKKSTNSGKVTLLTKGLGRGTDFICRDHRVIANGGVHVICTFLAEDITEEIQIKGRTARQGADGSFSIIIEWEQLEKFGINEQTIEDFSKASSFLKWVRKRFWKKQKDETFFSKLTLYDILDKARRSYFRRSYTSNLNFVQMSKKEHQKSEDFQKMILKHDLDHVKIYLKESNLGAQEEQSNCRTMILIDATCSMTELLQKTKQVILEVNEHLSETLKTQAKIPEGCYETQIVFYRNYNSDANKIIEHSGWEKNTKNLTSFVERIKVEGGMGNEAIEIALWYANECYRQENWLDQIILIGDMPANTQADVMEKRNAKFGDDYWDKSKFKKLTFYKTELEELKKNSIKVHTCYLTESAEKCFKEIADITGGTTMELDLLKKNPEKKLIDLISLETLKVIGKATKTGNLLEEEYKKKYGTSFL